MNNEQTEKGGKSLFFMLYMDIHTIFITQCVFKYHIGDDDDDDGTQGIEI